MGEIWSIKKSAGCPSTLAQQVAIRAPPRWHLSDKTFHASQVKMCVSNPEVWSQLVQSYSGGPGLSACEDDGSVGFCQCSRCRAWDPPGKGMGRDRGGQGDCVGLNAKVLGNCTGSYSDRYVLRRIFLSCHLSD